MVGVCSVCCLMFRVDSLMGYCLFLSWCVVYLVGCGLIVMFGFVVVDVFD